MKTLIVPTDFSPVSVNAMNYATDMAKSIGASIVLFHAYQVPVSFADAPVIAVSIEDMQRDAETRIADLKHSVEHITSGAVKVYTEVRMGDTVDQLELLCQSIQPFAVIMGSRGAGGLERLIMGSTTLTTIRHIKFPVIVVPPGTEYKTIGKIGLACDLKDVAESVPAEFIKNIVNEFKAELYVLNINTDREKSGTTDMPLESAYLDTLLASAKPNYYFLHKEDIVEGINEFAETNNLDLVMVIPKKHKLLESFFHKSSSRELVTHSHIPIVSIHE